MNERRNTEEGTPEYMKLNKQIKKKVRYDIRKHKTEHIKTVIENNKNMKVIKSINLIEKINIHQLKDNQGEIKYERGGPHCRKILYKPVFLS